jgi:modification methylase
VDLPSAVIGAAQNAGHTLVERNPALMAGLREGRLIPRSSFFQLLAARQARAAGIPQQVPVHEDVIVLRYDPPLAGVPLAPAVERNPVAGIPAVLAEGAERLAA